MPIIGEAYRLWETTDFCNFFMSQLLLIFELKAGVWVMLNRLIFKHKLSFSWLLYLTYQFDTAEDKFFAGYMEIDAGSRNNCI